MASQTGFSYKLIGAAVQGRLEGCRHASARPRTSLDVVGSLSGSSYSLKGSFILYLRMVGLLDKAHIVLEKHEAGVNSVATLDTPTSS